MNDQHAALLDTADRIAVTDLYPARLRTVIAALCAALRETSIQLDESREYGLARVEELRARAEKTDQFVAMAASMDEDFQLYTAKDPALAELVDAARGMMSHMPDYPDTVWQTFEEALTKIKPPHD